MANTPRLGMTYLTQNQANGEINHNAALNILDALIHCRVLDRDLTAPPAAVSGDTYIVATGATGAWAGKDNKIAIRYNNQWSFITPQDGFECWVMDEGISIRYLSNSWTMTSVFSRILGRRHFSSHADRGASTRTVIGATGATPVGTIGNSSDEAEGVFQTWTTTASSGNVAGNSIFTTGATGAGVQLRWMPIVAFRFKTPSDLTNIRLMLGLSASSPGSSDTPAVNSVLLRYSTGASDSGWVSYKYNGSGVASAQLSAINADTSYLLVLKARSPTSIEVWLGTNHTTLSLLQVITTGLPTSSVDLYPWITCTTLTTATKQIKVSKVEVEHD